MLVDHRPAILGQRHKDIRRHGLSAPPKFTPRFLFKYAKPRVLGLGDAGNKAAQLRQSARTALTTTPGHPAEPVAHGRQVDQLSLNWKTHRLDQDSFGEELIVKGVWIPKTRGSRWPTEWDGIIVSTREDAGGLRRRTRFSSISALPAVVDAVGDKTEVYVDGGDYSGPRTSSRRLL